MDMSDIAGIVISVKTLCCVIICRSVCLCVSVCLLISVPPHTQADNDNDDVFSYESMMSDHVSGLFRSLYADVLTVRITSRVVYQV